jgi:hypothetical protein
VEPTDEGLGWGLAKSQNFKLFQDPG